MNNLGLQLYTVRGTLETEAQLKENFKKLHDMGYTEFQTASPFMPLDLEPEKLRVICDETGTKIIGTHMDYDMILNDTDRVIEAHKILGAKCVGVGGAPIEKKSRETILEFIEKTNKVSEKLAAAGLKFTYHHHQFEFIKYDGKRMLDYLVEGLDKDTVSFVLDTYWIQCGGGDIIDWMDKLSGRIDILHLKDMMILPDHTQHDTEVLEGNINFDGVMKKAKEIGVKHFCVELDRPRENPYESAEISAKNILARY